MKYAVVLDIDDDIFKNYHNICIDYQIKGISNDTDNNIYDVLDSQEIYPIKELPHKEEANTESETEFSLIDNAWTQGFNDCLGEILDVDYDS